MWAQTDVTSTYLTNADFEGSYSSLTTVTGTALDSRSVQDPDGWTLTCGGTFHKWDSSVLKSTDATYSSNISKRITIPNTGFGNQTYAFRCQGSKSGETLRLSQTTKTELPRGKYTLSAKLHTDHKDNMEASLYINQYASGRTKATTNAGKDVWDDVSKSFTIVSPRTIEVGVYFSHNTTADYTAAVDNVTLSYENYTDDLSTMITKATALSNGSLTSAISTAQGVLDSKNNTVAYQTTIDNAVATLQAAIISAQSADGSSLTPAIQNPGFEGGQSWYVKTAGADTYDVDQWTKASAFDAGTYHYSCLTTDQKSEGSNSFKVRLNWASQSQTFTQRIPELPLGRYTLTADVKATNGGSSTIDFYIKGNSTKGESITAATSDFQTITAVVDLNTAGDLDIILGMDYTNLSSASSEAIAYWDNVTLTYNNPEALYTSTKSAAQDTYNDHDYDNVTGDERTALYGLLNPSPAPSTVAEYFAAIDDINDAVAAFTAAKTNYDKYVAEAENADALGVDPIPALDVASNYSDKLKALIVLEDDAVTTGYPEDATGVVDAWDVANGELNTWTKNNVGEGNTDHWSGNSVTYYNTYSGSGFTMSAKKTVSLPAGSYVLKAAARCNKVNEADQFYLGVTVDGESLVKEIYTSTGGGSGLGIDKTGAANYTAADDTYANSNNGFGWEWRFVPFTLTETKDVELKITANILATGWVSFSDIQLLTTSSNEAVFAQIYNNAKTSAEDARDHDNYTNVDGKEKKDLTDAIDASVTASIAGYSSQKSTLDDAIAAFTAAKTNYNSLATAISNANTIITNSINVGDGAFQVPTTIRETLATAKATAESTKSNVETTSAGAATAATTLNTAITTYNSDFATATLNEPADGAVFNVMITTNDSYGFKDKPLTFNSDNVSGANFYKAYGVTPYRAQQITFTKVSGNQYTLSMVNADGDRVFIRTNAPGKGGSGNANQIRLTTIEDNALAVQIIPSISVDGVYNLKNTEAVALLGCQDDDSKSSGGLYTVGVHNDFTITSASKPSVSIDIETDVKLATRIFPFTPVLPSGVKAYSCEASAGDNLTLVEVDEPAANTPYILYAEDGYFGDALTGYGTASAETYTDGWLTGVYTTSAAPNGSYVLQNGASGVAFYQVNTSEATPSVGAYRCYLTTGSGARALYINFDEATAVKTIKALTSGKNTIYNAAGAEVPSLQKGLNIIKTSDGTIRKVMVK